MESVSKLSNLTSSQLLVSAWGLRIGVSFGFWVARFLWRCQCLTHLIHYQVSFQFPITKFQIWQPSWSRSKSKDFKKVLDKPLDNHHRNPGLFYILGFFRDIEGPKPGHQTFWIHPFHLQRARWLDCQEQVSFGYHSLFYCWRSSMFTKRNKLAYPYLEQTAVITVIVRSSSLLAQGRLFCCRLEGDKCLLTSTVIFLASKVIRNLPPLDYSGKIQVQALNSF